MATAVEAQVTGTVWKIEAREGQGLAEGDVIMTLESMKMEIPVEAPCGGTLREIRVDEGEMVEEGAILALIESLSE
jgi:acetyl-CoA carboxylase biotin carboxyl carrier protein